MFAHFLMLYLQISFKAAILVQKIMGYGLVYQKKNI